MKKRGSSLTGPQHKQLNASNSDSYNKETKPNERSTFETGTISSIILIWNWIEHFYTLNFNNFNNMFITIEYELLFLTVNNE